MAFRIKKNDYKVLKRKIDLLRNLYLAKICFQTKGKFLSLLEINVVKKGNNGK